MRKLELVLTGVLALSPAMFAQQRASTNNQGATQSTPAMNGQKAGKEKLTADQKAELKDLRAKAKDACKADKKSESCKTARQDLHAKLNEYGVKHRWHRGHKPATGGSGAQSPS